MALDLANSPYAATPPQGTPQEGLGYSRHYAQAQRIRDFGRSSKESWIKRLWNHMINKTKTKGSGSESSDKSSDSGKSMGANQGHPPPVAGGKGAHTVLPPIKRENSMVNATQGNGGARPKEVSFKQGWVSPSSGNSSHSGDSRDGSKSAPAGSSSNAGRTRDGNKKIPIPPELANSPYIAPKDRPNYQVKEKRKAEALLKSHSSKDLTTKKQREKDMMFIRKQLHPYLSQHPDTWKPKITRGGNMIQLEKRAKAEAESAMKTSKVFTCEGPYPVDAYVRYSLRKRGWVEKFGPKANTAVSRGGISNKLECSQDEDFDAICGQEVPHPWEEDYGVYSIMSRIVRHFPAKFIWGGRNVNSLILKSEVIVNHFPKARYFSSKVGLTSSLRDLPWQNDSHAFEFFPRCYILNEDDKEDIIDDFRLAACMAILKWVLKMYIARDGHHGAPKHTVQRDNTKYEEVTSSRDNRDMSVTQEQSIFEGVNPLPTSDSYDKKCTADDECKVENTSASKTDELTEKCEGISDVHREKDIEVANEEGELVKSANPRRVSAQSNQSTSSMVNNNDANEESLDGAVNQSCVRELTGSDLIGDLDRQSSMLLSDTEEESIASSATERNAKEQIKSNQPRDFCLEKAHTAIPAKFTRSQVSRWQSASVVERKRPTENCYDDDKDEGPVLPDLRALRKERRGGEVPAKAVDWALGHLDRFLRCKSHEDIDGFKKRGLTATQWDQLLGWFYQISQEGASLSITEGKLRECEDMLRAMKRVWPQYELDGNRDIWIVKPGDKSKGIGIEFIDRLDDILKYISNATQQGNYVVQKYIERPMLIYRCKFDIRQWFVVTEWNPLTIWFYKDSYLRICSQEFNYDTMHESVHLSNVAVQQNYQNAPKRSTKLPDNNFLTSIQFQEYIRDQGDGEAWNEITYPGMKLAVINTLIATQDVTENRRSAFELYGADFMMSEDYRPWLLEINASPGMAPSSKEKAKLCAAVIDDTIKVVLDRRESRDCDVGRYELAFRDSPVPPVKVVENKLLLEGHKIKKIDLQRYTQLDLKATRNEKEKERKEKEKMEKEKKKENEVKPTENATKEECAENKKYIVTTDDDSHEQNLNLSVQATSEESRAGEGKSQDEQSNDIGETESTSNTE